MFLLGAICGGITMLMGGILIGALTVEEKDKQIDYLKSKLYEQAKQAKYEQYGYRRNNKQDGESNRP